MAETKIKTGKGKNKHKKGVFQKSMPVKKTINLVLVNENKVSIPKAFLGILLIILLAGTFSKFLVVDRLAAMSAAAGAAAERKNTLEKIQNSLKDFEGIQDTYAHYTYADMTQEEMSLVDRDRVLGMIKAVVPRNNTTGWSLTGNILTIDLKAKSLKKLNSLAKKIEKQSIVDSCTITTANKTEDKKKTNNQETDTETEVKGRLLIYLKQPSEEEEES